MKAGVVGLGLMGSRMAANLRAKGFEVAVHNRTASKADALRAAGAIWAATPASAAGGSEVVFTMLSTPQAVREVATTAPGGLLEGLRPGSLWVDCSTVNPSFAREMARMAAGRGAAFLDAPVAGSTGPAERGELLFLVGGEAEDVARCGPLFEAMGKKIVHAGGHGMGAAMKMVVNLLLAAGMAAFAEALALGGDLGIAQGTLLDVLLGSPVAAPFLAGKREKIEAGDYSPEFPLRWMQKDLHLVATTAWEEGVALPVANTLKEVYQLAARAGLAEEDFSAVCRFLREKRDKAG